MLGLRFYFNERHKREWMTDGTLDWLWPAAEKAGVPVALASALFLPTVGQIAERHPNLKLIVAIWPCPPGTTANPPIAFSRSCGRSPNIPTSRSR